VPSALASTTTSSSVRGTAVAIALAVALGVPVIAARAWCSAYADGLAVSIASGALAVAPSLRAASDTSREALTDELEVDAPALPAEESPTVLAALPAKSGKPRGPARPGGPQHGIRVSAAQVLALAARRAMPQAVPVKATAQHPAGLQLRGVSALGVGLQDGDVLTEAAGQKATSVAAVVGIVLAARGRQVPEISGRFYRGGVPFSLSVEQPYPNAPVPG
jgi:hypothetical protein